MQLIGIISPGDSVYSLMDLMKYISSKKIHKIEPSIEDSANSTISVVGDNNKITVIQVTNEVAELIKQPSNAELVQKIVTPTVMDGYTNIKFENSEGSIVDIDKESAIDIKSYYFESDEVDTELEAPQVITAWIKVYSPVYEVKHDKWQFTYDRQHHFMDITETSIAEMALKRGGALVNDAYKVELEIRQNRKTLRSIYKILRVIDFRAAQINEQQELDIN